MIGIYVTGYFSPDREKIYTTDENKFWPVYAMSFLGLYMDTHYNEDGKVINKIVDNVYAYFRPKAGYYYGNFAKYSQLFSQLNFSLSTYRFNFTYAGQDHYIDCLKGYIVDSENNILLCVATNTPKEIHNPEEVDYKEYTLFVSTKFISEEKYKNIYKKIYTDFIQKAFSLETQVVFTSSEKIEENLFNTSNKIKFNTLTELNEHLKNKVGELLFFEFKEDVTHTKRTLFSGVVNAWKDVVELVEHPIDVQPITIETRTESHFELVDDDEANSQENEIQQIQNEFSENNFLNN